MPRLEVSVLGPVALALAGKPVQLPKKALILMAYLAVEGRRTHRRTELAALLWPDAPESKALHNLRQTLSTLRKALMLDEDGGPHLRIGRDTVALAAGGGHWLDLDALTRPMACPDDPDQRRHCRADCLQRAGLRRGPFFEDIALPDNEAFEHWLTIRRENADRGVAEVLSRLSDCHDGTGETTGALAVLRQRIGLDPWDEKAHRALMRELSERGDDAAALRHCEAFSTRIRAELGIDPEDETQRLYRSIRRKRTQAEGRLPEVLIVEDEPATRALFAAFLRKNGFLVQEAASAGEMRDALARGAFDAIVLDVNLPDGDGFRLVADLVRSGDSGLLFVTNRRSRADRVAGLDLGADDYLVKPVHLPELAARLRSVLRRR